MPVAVTSNHLMDIYLTELRHKSTNNDRYRLLTRRVARLLAINCADRLSSKSVTVETPLETTEGKIWSHNLVLIPILRAGLGLLDGFVDMFDDAEIGFLGLQRNQETKQVDVYLEKLPNLDNKNVILLDPMLATGNSCCLALKRLQSERLKSLTMACIVAAPEGVATVEAQAPSLHIVTATIDRELDNSGYILPGLGDYGDRLFA